MEQTLYKLTTADWKTRKGYPEETTWGPGVTHTAKGMGDLCSKGWIHAYTSPNLALFLDPIHANIGEEAILWECTGMVGKQDKGLKVGVVSLTTIKVLNAPKPTIIQRRAFGIMCALSVYKDKNFVLWAENWLNNRNRTYATAAAAATATATANSAAAAYAAAYYAAYYAADIADVAYAAAYAADAADALDLQTIADKAATFEVTS